MIFNLLLQFFYSRVVFHHHHMSHFIMRINKTLLVSGIGRGGDGHDADKQEFSFHNIQSPPICTIGKQYIPKYKPKLRFYSHLELKNIINMGIFRIFVT